MKQKFVFKNQVFAKDWKEFHPDNDSSQTDSYYIKLCNKILNQYPLIPEESMLANSTNKKELVCMLVAYFEDIVSEARIWQSFTEEHFRLYGKYLPFYDTTPQNEYDPSSFNIEDVRFLIWHFMEEKTEYKNLFHPFARDIFEISACVYDIFEDGFDNAPINDDLLDFLYIDEYLDMYDKRSIIEFLRGNCYLHKTYYDIYLSKIKDKMLSQNNVHHKELSIFLYDFMLDYSFNLRSPLLAMRSNELLAKIIGEDHPEYEIIRSISEKKRGTFLFKSENETHLKFVHILSGSEIDILKESIEFGANKKFMPNKTQALFAFVKWGNEYWQTGIMVLSDYDPEDFKKNPPPMSEYDIFAEEKDQQKFLQKQEADFLKSTKGKHLVYFENGNDLDKFLKREANFKSSEQDNLRNILVFFNPKTGIEIYPEMGKYSDKTIKLADDVDLMSLLCEDSISVGFTKYVIENNLMDKDTFVLEDYLFVWDDMDFIIRYFKPDLYFEKSQMHVFNSKKALVIPDHSLL